MAKSQKTVSKVCCSKPGKKLIRFSNVSIQFNSSNEIKKINN